MSFHKQQMESEPAKPLRYALNHERLMSLVNNRLTMRQLRQWQGTGLALQHSVSPMAARRLIFASKLLRSGLDVNYATGAFLPTNGLADEASGKGKHAIYLARSNNSKPGHLQGSKWSEDAVQTVRDMFDPQDLELS